MEIEFPIIIAEGMDVMFFSSKEDAERAVEPADLAGGELRIWDGYGRKLRIQTYRNPSSRKNLVDAIFPFHEPVTIVDLPGEDDSLELRSVLTTFLIHRDEKKYHYLRSNDLPLVNLLREAQGYS